MTGATAGIHHITAIAGDPQKNLDFYCGLLGMRLVKKTVNFDDPETYHFYFGDRVGSPGSILTFFPWTASGLRGRPGFGQVTVISFSVPRGSLAFWRTRLEQSHVQMTATQEKSIAFRDPDGLALQLVDAEDPPSGEGWTGSVPAEDAIRGFHAAALSVEKVEETARFLSTTLGFTRVSEGPRGLRLAAKEGGIGSVVEVSAAASAQGRMGVGTVHHIAWRVRDDGEQRAFRAAVVATGVPATPVIDRIYFRSVYFHEPGGILFEIATDPPGFMRDEPEESLGTSLKLPPWLEALRPRLEKALPVVSPERIWTPAG